MDKRWSSRSAYFTPPPTVTIITTTTEPSHKEVTQGTLILIRGRGSGAVGWEGDV